MARRTVLKGAGRKKPGGSGDRGAKIAKSAQRPAPSASAGRRSRATTASDKHAGISSSAVDARTGRTWREWFQALDAAGARELNGKEIVLLLRDHFHLAGWWAQMVAAGYQQAVLGRKKNEKSDGFEITATRTLNVAVDTLYESWANPRLRSRWLAESGLLVVKRAANNKSMRITWPDGASVSVSFLDHGGGRSRVQVQHGNLRSATAAARAKTTWKNRLNALVAALEGAPD